MIAQDALIEEVERIGDTLKSDIADPIREAMWILRRSDFAKNALSPDTDH